MHGPHRLPFSRCGVEITDSAYVVLNMQLMTRMGTQRWSASRATHLRPGLHSTGDLNPERRFIMHFPKSCPSRASARLRRNALLGKKCHACALPVGRRARGLVAEHMLIVGIENPR